ncbi:MAG: AraC family transcriptional regulator [Bacteroidaceae bacterium]|nr:AraC family transcriptional regulator [Bacteroidaceae bacterium]
MESVEQLHLLALNVGLAHHYADWNWQHVNSPFARIYYVVEGESELILPDGVHLLRPGYMYFIPPFTTHSCRCNALFVHYYLHVYEDAPDSAGFLDEWNFPTEIVGGELERMLFERLCKLNPHMALLHSDPTSYDNHLTLKQNITKNRQRTFSNRVESRGIVFQLFARFLAEGRKGHASIDERIRSSLVYIRQNIRRPITISQLAEKANLSKDHYIRLFTREMGITPLQYVNRKKIEQAQLIMLTRGLPVKSVAYMLGFEDHSYFNRLFRKISGYTPIGYREMLTVKN